MTVRQFQICDGYSVIEVGDSAKKVGLRIREELMELNMEIIKLALQIILSPKKILLCEKLPNYSVVKNKFKEESYRYAKFSKVR